MYSIARCRDAGGIRMPSKPKQPCVMCRNLTTERYCNEHAHSKREKQRQMNRFYDQFKRDRGAKRFYKSQEWDRVRQQVLVRDYGLCQNCLQHKRVTPADVVDHSKPLRLFWHLRSVFSNLRSLCHKCHAGKTAKDRDRYRSRGGG